MIRQFFSFRKMIAKDLIKIVYAIGAIVLTLLGIFVIAGAVLFEFHPGGDFIEFIILGLTILIVGNVVWRAFCEYSFVLFSIHEGIWKLVPGEGNQNSKHEGR
ncbi:MAG TPA: DUF4282 domain-containing protein [archaeon]|nr:DUF4282 domain-containing protein [archaeon]